MGAQKEWQLTKGNEVSWQDTANIVDGI